MQRKAARFCTGNSKQTVSVTDIIKKIGLGYFGVKQTKVQINKMYTLSHKIVNFDTSQYLVFNSEKRTRGSHNFKYVTPKINKDVFKYSFFPRTIKDRDSLPSTLVSMNSYESFQSKLNSLKIFIQRQSNYTYFYYILNLGYCKLLTSAVGVIPYTVLPTKFMQMWMHVSLVIHQQVSKRFFSLFVLSIHKVDSVLIKHSFVDNSNFGREQNRFFHFL